ncbi:thermonuclease family protein [Bacillus piscicola]|uniref:thermonuclease family protein n=1 Tax=Bacillus piscicola TaxID=1632684 RepID=UPI001F0A0142|nr:thermonuclease family protein [Bacillus piscicola]
MNNKRIGILKIGVIFIVFVLSLAGCTSEVSKQAIVTEIVDGDTLKVKMADGTAETIRLLLVDTPETVHPNKAVQPYGPEASTFAKEHLPAGKEVSVEVDTTIRDDYGRFLAYIWVDDDKMFNRMLLEEGLARVAYVIEPNTRYADDFLKIEAKARSAGKGIWKEEGYVTEKGFIPEAIESNRQNEILKENQAAETTTKKSCENPAIKGNHSSNGDFIYHLPGSQHYGQTIAEEMFCTEREAREAGYRPGKR